MREKIQDATSPHMFNHDELSGSSAALKGPNGFHLIEKSSPKYLQVSTSAFIITAQEKHQKSLIL